MPYKNIEDRRKSLKRWVKALRLRVLKKFGGKCVRCGISDFRVLQIDHIFGRGGVDRKKWTCIAFYRWILNTPKAIEELEKYQLLCANCNWIKKYENQEVRKP